MGRGDLSDAEWELIGPLLPPERGSWARPAGDNRLPQWNASRAAGRLTLARHA